MKHSDIKRLILLLISSVLLASCSAQVKVDDPETLTAAVVAAGDSVTAKNACELLSASTVATLEVSRVDASYGDSYSEYDILYIDKSVTEVPSFDAEAVMEFAKNGGGVFLDNETYTLFGNDFIGAQSFEPIGECPIRMTYEETGSRETERIVGLIRDFCYLYENYVNYETALSLQSYGVGVVPSTAVCLASMDGLGVYTLNEYGKGTVFFTNPLLPNYFSVNNLSPANTGEPLAASTIGANKLLRDYFAELVSIRKYGYAVENVAGSFARPAASWELHYEDITGIENESAEMFEQMCENYGQVPSFSLARNPYIWFRRAESVTYALNNGGKYEMDPYENAYSAGTHFVSGKKWLSLDYYDNTISYFEDSADYTKRAYPWPVDHNRDGNMDLICGSADGRIYFFEGYGMKTNYEFGYECCFTDADGTPISVGAYSSPVLADIDNDGEAEIISGSEDGVIRAFENSRGMILEDVGIVNETGLVDAMPAFGDLNGDGVLDMAVGSRGGELRIYYGAIGAYGVMFDSYETLSGFSTWCAPCIADTDNDGMNELYAGTFDGYIGRLENNELVGYLEGSERNYKGNNNLKFGTNCVPRFYDINGDGAIDLLAGSLEYGMAVPVDSEYFPYKDKLKKQIDGFKKRGIYVGVHGMSHDYADPFHDERELEYHKNAFKSYGLDFTGGGVNQHTWRTSKVGYDAFFDNTNGYDGTYKKQFEAGLLWNSGSKTPNSEAMPEASAENSILAPFYLDNGMLMLQPCTIPNGPQEYTRVSAKYELPLLFYNHCDYIYRDPGAEDNKIRQVDGIVTDYGYNFVMENQLVKMAAASMNNHVLAKRTDDGLLLSAAPRSVDKPLYDEDYQSCCGVRIIFADDINVDAFSVRASVSYTRDNMIYASLDKGIKISGPGEEDGLKIVSVNLPAKISKSDTGAVIRFADGGMMSAAVAGNARTSSVGWQTSQENGFTVFRKYGKADILKIER